MQHKRNGQIAGAKDSIKTGKKSKYATIVERKVTLDQIIEQNHNNQGMIQEDTTVIITRENLSMGNAIIVEEKATDNLNVEPGSII